MGFHWFLIEMVCTKRQREGREVRVRHRPSEGVEEADPAITGSPVKICARAASVGEEGGAVETGGEDHGGAVQWWRYFPSLAAPLC
jgi:hypothetical protein